MHNHGYGRVRIEFRVPPRTNWTPQPVADRYPRNNCDEFTFDGYTERQGEIPHRLTGALVADRDGVTTPILLRPPERGELFVGVTIDVYEGMIIGENAKDTDLDVNVVREKKLTTSDLLRRYRGPPGSLPSIESGAGNRIHRRRRIRRSHS